MLEKRDFYINGQWIPPENGHDCEVINPSHAKTCGIISLGGTADVNKAVKAAKKAFPAWSETSVEQRITLLKELKKIYKKRGDEMAEIISLEMGCPIDLSRTDQVGAGASHISNTIRELENFVFEHPLNERFTDTLIVKESIGVCALITPWNWPMNQVTLKVIPALGTGCTMILKPSELSPLSAMLFTEMVDQAGFPPGVFNLINGDGNGVGTALSGHPEIDMVSFTGSTRAGKAITKNAADTIKRVSLELGGKGANIIFADADEKSVVQGVRDCFQNSGQSCNAPTRMLVERPLYEQALETAKNIAEKTTVDDALKKGHHIGPLISKTQWEKIQTLIQSGLNEGAKLIAGGEGHPNGFEEGYFVKPTVFADVNNSMTIMQKEIFGPVLAIMPFDTEEEAVAIANDTPYGLTNYLSTRDQEKAQRVARKLRSGMVEINGEPRGSGAPFGGYKQSGNGREGGKWGIEEYLEIKVISG